MYGLALPRSLASLLLLLLFGSGCAFTRVELSLPSDLPSSRPGIGKGRQVAVAPFRDEREVHDRCGMKKNGYNMDTADAVCRSDPREWLTDLLMRGLSESGFRVMRSEAPAVAASPPPRPSTRPASAGRGRWGASAHS